MKLILHVGFHKTGTSSIQAFGRLNRNKLAQQGILYPKTGIAKLQYPSTSSSEGGHRMFEGILASPTNSKAKLKLQSIMEEADSFGSIDTVLISSETFSAPKIRISNATLTTLRQYFSEIKILAYLRRQDDWAESFYKEVLCWSGHSSVLTTNFYLSG